MKKDLNIATSVTGADASRQNLDKIRDSIQGLGTEGLVRRCITRRSIV